jgi:chromatin remodeling complex protein RSC6
MARTKTTKTTETEQVVATPAVVDAAPAPVKAPKVVKKTKAAAPVVPVSETPVVEVPVDETVVDQENLPNDQIIEFNAKLQQLGVIISSLKSEFKTLEKKWSRDLKAAQKLNSKRKRKAGNRAPSGFVKPTRISDELAMFLEKPSGTEMARTEVTREINTYIRNNKLQDSSNGRKINPDTKLASLLKLQKTDELTYFNLQRYMSPHFAKAVKAEVAASV